MMASKSIGMCQANQAFHAVSCCVMQIIVLILLNYDLHVGGLCYISALDV